MTKWIIAVVVVVIIAGGAWWYFTQGPGATGTTAVEPVATSTAPDTSNQALINDSASIDAQVQQIDSAQ